MAKTVKINGVTYSGITQVLLPLADGTGNAVFKEDSGGGGGDTTPALYPLPWSRFVGATTTKEVSNGNHVKIHSTTTARTFVINIPHSVNSIISARSFDASTMYYPIIPEGTEVTIAMKNVETNLEGYALGTTTPGGSTDMNGSPLGKDEQGGISGTNDRKSFTFTTTGATQISSFYLAFSGTGDADIEFDFELTVGGVRWI